MKSVFASTKFKNMNIFNFSAKSRIIVQKLQTSNTRLSLDVTFSYNSHFTTFGEAKNTTYLFFFCSFLHFRKSKA